MNRREQVGLFISISLILATIFGPRAFAFGPAPERPVAPLRPGLQAELPFDFQKDGLCFGNFIDSFEYGTFPLKQWANKTGSCQGMAGLSRAFLRYANFSCSGEKPTRDQALALIQQARKFQAARCPSAEYKVQINGFCSMREMCEAHRDLFQAQAIDLNAKIAMEQISRDLRYLLEGKTSAAQKRNAETIWRLYFALKQGRYPMMHYRWHAVMITGLKIEWDAERRAPVALITEYNPNFPDSPVVRPVAISSDFTETVDEEPIFILMPETSSQMRSCDR